MKVTAWYRCRHCGARQDITRTTMGNNKQARFIIDGLINGQIAIAHREFVGRLTHKCNETTWSIMDITSVTDVEET